MKLLTPIRSQKVWGYEDWIASTHKDGEQKEFSSLVKDYPLLVKIIQANDTLSVQVHPDDKTAVELEGSGARGKTECWFVLDALPGSKLICGLKQKYSTDELSKAIKENTLQNLLNSVEVKKGDFIFIPSGTVHAIGGGLRLLEVQQSCNITYRLYDWGRPRELHIEKGLKSIKYEKYTDAKADTREFDVLKVQALPSVFECPYFELVKKEFSGGYSYLCPSSSNFELLFCVNSQNLKAVSTMSGGQKTKTEQILSEQIFVIAPGEKVTLEGKGEIIRIKTR